MSHTNVVDISGLTDCGELHLAGCFKIANFSAVGGQSVVDLSGLAIGDDLVARLGAARRVTLANCLQVTDVSALANAEMVDLTNCSRVTSVAVLRAVPFLTVFGCTGIARARAKPG